MVTASFDLTLGNYASRTSMSVFLRMDPSPQRTPAPGLNIAAGSGNANIATVRLTEDFHLGPPIRGEASPISGPRLGTRFC